jgi:hypothetical protein
VKYYGFVYETTNLITGKKYIGSHIGKESDFYIGNNSELFQDLEKYGPGCFDKVVLEHAADLASLATAEKKYLQSVDARHNPQYYNQSNMPNGIQRQPKLLLDRPLCAACHNRPAAVNCHKNERVYYRSVCDNCARHNKKHKIAKPAWQKAGYKKKLVCDRCGFRAKNSAQTLVYHTDGNTNNTELSNLRSICLNCAVEVSRECLPWRRGDLEEDR